MQTTTHDTVQVLISRSKANGGTPAYAFPVRENAAEFRNELYGRCATVKHDGRESLYTGEGWSVLLVTEDD